METNLLNKLFLLISIRTSRTLRESNCTAISQFAYIKFLICVYLFQKWVLSFFPGIRRPGRAADHPLTTLYRRSWVWVGVCLNLSSMSAWNVTEQPSLIYVCVCVGCVSKMLTTVFIKRKLCALGVICFPSVVSKLKFRNN